MGDVVFAGGLRPDGLQAALSAPERLTAVRATGLLDTGPEGPFDDLARLAAAVTVVGDLLDLFRAKGPWWCTVMGDVCGKGTEAAKVTALARYTLRAEATQHLSPAAVLTHLNRALLDQRGGDRFLTAVYATFRATPSGVAGCAPRATLRP